MAFNGVVPGPVPVVHQYDWVDLTLVNGSTDTLCFGVAGNAQAHNIDFHAATGAMGDRAFYFGEQDYYVPMNDDRTSKRYDNFTMQMGDWLDVMKGLTPTHIAFNGKYGALTADTRLEAEVGETVLMLHSQANNPSYPHLIGGHGDWVWPYGKFNNRPLEGLESWAVVAGGTAAAVYTFEQEGTYAYLNHNLIKAFLYDAKAFIHVEGGWDDEIMTQSIAPRPMTTTAGPTGPAAEGSTVR